MTEELRFEVRMVLSAVAGLFLGRKVLVPQAAPPDQGWVERAHKRNLAIARDLLRERLKFESDGIESVRRRSEFALTAIIAVAGLSAGGFERLWKVSEQSPWPLVLCAVGIATTAFSVLIFGGVAVSKKVLGTVEPKSFAELKDAQREELRQYLSAIEVTSQTRRALVTVFRDGFLIALLGLAVLAAAHAVSWIIPLQDPVAPVVVNIFAACAPLGGQSLS
ncbi:hypothetical protein AB3M83_01435 [Microbacterium sp. 179-B 1A2 NHS]|uniref:hypothetical protein n=1 Tax=Microbacterium sp. 179-B 1A2 NHS TaxID=3142383 RepID=UPI0039A27F32